jgi:hypothetical protein
MPRDGMCKIKNVSARHPFDKLRAMAERVCHAILAAARHQRSISTWNVLSSGVTPDLSRRRASSEESVPTVLEPGRNPAAVFP